MSTWNTETKQLALKYAIGLIALFYLWSMLFNLISLQHKPFITTPWSIIEHVTSHNSNSAVKKKVIISGGIVLVIFIGLFAAAARQRYLMTLHGDAHWATESEIRKAGLRSTDGVLIGKVGGEFLCAGGTENIGGFSPPRSGKGVGLVIPNCLNFNGSLVVLDVRREAYDKTSGYRKKYSQVFILDFFNDAGNTHRYNPLSFIDKHNKVTRYNEIDKLASKLWPQENDKGDIWQPEARTLFNAICLLLIDLRSTRFTIGEVLRFVQGTTDLTETFTQILKSDSSKLDPLCIMGVNNFLQKASKEASGVLSTLKSGISLWNNPVVDASTSETDFDIRELRRKRISIYLSVKPGDIGRAGKLISMFFENIIDAMTHHMPGVDEPHRVLMLMDEFTLLPKMPMLEKGVAFLSGYNVITMPIIQAMTQLEAVYGAAQARTFIQTHKYRIVFAQNDEQTAQRISNELGHKTIRSFSFSTNNSYSKSGDGSTSSSFIKRELMKPNEIMKLDKAKEIIMIEGMSPILAKKIVYYTDKAFKDRLLLPASMPCIDLAGHVKAVSQPALNLKTVTATEKDTDTIVNVFFAESGV